MQNVEDPKNISTSNRTTTMTGKLDTIVLTDCSNNKELRTHSYESNSVTWGAGLTTDQYVSREYLLSESELCSAHLRTEELHNDVDIKDEEAHGIFRAYLGVRQFVLKDMELPNTSQTSQVVASIETLNRVGYVIAPNSKEQTPVLSVCIGGVYTKAEHRGKGYASKMMTLLNKHYDDLVLTEEGSKTGKFLEWKIMTLYSEVGEFYNSFGYISKPVPVHHIDNLDAIINEIGDILSDDMREIEYLDFGGYEELVDLELKETNLLLNKSLKKRGSDNRTCTFLIKPDILIYQWFAVRDDFIAQHKCPELIANEPLKYGVSLKERNGTQAHCIWHHAWADNALYILKLYVEDEKDLIELLKYVILEAKKYNLTAIHVWDTDMSKKQYPELFRVLEKIIDPKHLTVENPSLSAIRYPFEDIEWVNNSKYCWF